MIRTVIRIVISTVIRILIRAEIRTIQNVTVDTAAWCDVESRLAVNVCK